MAMLGLSEEESPVLKAPGWHPGVINLRMINQSRILKTWDRGTTGITV